jgi:hypothetical protein
MPHTVCDECKGHFAESELVRVAPLEYLCPKCRAIRAATARMGNTSSSVSDLQGCALPSLLFVAGLTAVVRQVLS